MIIGMQPESEQDVLIQLFFQIPHTYGIVYLRENSICFHRQNFPTLPLLGDVWPIANIANGSNLSI